MLEEYPEWESPDVIAWQPLPEPYCPEEEPKKMSGGWISVEEQLPTVGKRLLAKIKHHKWISDYDSASVPDKEKIVHQEYMEVCEITGGADGIWQYVNLDDGPVEAYIKPGENLATPVDEIIAWRPMPELYR